MTPDLTILDFCCNVKLMQSAVGINITEASCLISKVQASGGDGVGHNFLARFGPFKLFKCHSLLE